MLKESLDTSIIVLLLRYLYRWHSYTEHRIVDIYRNSQMHRLIGIFWEKVKLFFRFSFLGRITDIKEEENTAILNNSKAVRYLIDFYRSRRDKISYYLNTSKTVDLIRETKEKFYLLPVKMASVILVITVTTNITLSIVLQREISLWGWSICGLLLFIGSGGLFCNADLQNIMENSLVLRCIRRLKS